MLWVCQQALKFAAHIASKKRWKGFHKLKVDARPSGEALRKLEEKEERTEMQRYRATGCHMPVYKSSYKQDLSALMI